MRNHRRVGAALLALGVALAPAVAPAQATAPSPPPAASTPPAPAAPAAPVAPAAPAAPRAVPSLANADEVRQGVARLERGGRPIGMGAVLRSDGRILTALSALGHGNFIDARFADGSVLRVRVVHTDRVWDLALLSPEGGHWTLGLRPSVIEQPAPGSSLIRFRARGARLDEGALTVSAAPTVLGHDGATLSDVLALSSRVSDDELGSPLLDPSGEVAAIVIQACAPVAAGGCQLGPFGAPVGALKQFLRKAPRRDPLPAASLGFRGVAAHEGSIAGVRVLTVDPGGPAARAGLRAEASRRAGSAAEPSADLIVAVQDAPVTTPEEMADAINRFAFATSAGDASAGGDELAGDQAGGGKAGADKAEAPTGEGASNPAAGASKAAERRVRLLVFGSGKFREVSLPVPPPRRLPEVEPAAPAPPKGTSSRQTTLPNGHGVPRENTPPSPTRL